MKPTTDVHRARPWRVHAIAPDFKLLDLWGFALGDQPVDLRQFLDCVWGAAGGIAESRLARARLRIGAALRWDDHDFTLPIPGCTETTVADRLTAADRAANRASPDAPSPLAVPSPVVKTVYILEDEALYEFSNDTIHGLLHVGLVRAEATASLAVYIKSRGAFSRVYMAAISPARHLVIYPALIKRVEQRWLGK